MSLKSLILGVFLAATVSLSAQSVHDAAASGNLTRLDSLYQLDAQCVKAVHPQNGGQPLHMAAWAGQKEAIAWLIEKGADPNALDTRNFPVLVWAFPNGHLDVMKQLIAFGADVQAMHPRMGSLLHIASSNSNEAVIDFLVGQGLDINLAESFGFTPLHFAVLRKNTPAVKALLKNGANAMTSNQDGSTPFFMAVDAGDTTVVGAFFDAGLLVNAVNTFGDTPLHAAVYGGHEELTQYLIAKGVDIHKKDGDGRTISDIAHGRGLTGLLTLLEEAGVKRSALATQSQSVFNAVQPLGPGLEKSVKVTVIYDNFVHRQGMEADWGFSLFIEGIEKNILFDTGTKADLFMKNFDALGLDASSVDMVFLTHEHGDHTGGLFRFLERRTDLPVVMPHSFSYSFVRRTASAGAKPVALKSPVALCENVYSSGELGAEIKEHCVILNTVKGLVVITGCSHPGIIEMLESVQSTFKKKVHMVFGGFHLMRKSDEEMATIIAKMKALGIEKCGATHCTGDHQIELFKKAFGENYVALGVGNVLTF